MKPVLKAFALLVVVLVVVGAIGLWYFINSGVSAKEQPGRMEEFAARRVAETASAAAGQRFSGARNIGHRCSAVSLVVDECDSREALAGNGDRLALRE